MNFNFKKLGNFIEEINTKNLSNEIIFPLGIRKKSFSKHKDDLPDHDLLDCKVVLKNQFCYVPVTSRNGDRISIALLTEAERALVSKTYLVFQIKDTNILQPNYLMMWFRKREFDRYARYYSWGSARETFNWEFLCNFLIPLLSIEKQNRLVEQFKNLDQQIQIRKIISKKLRKLIVLQKRFFHNPELERILGKNIKLISRKNKNNEIKNLVGVSGTKQIVDYGGIVKNEDFTKFKVVQKNEFVWSPDVLKLCSLSCWTGDSPVLVSSTYQVFSIVNENLLSLGYLMSCFLDPQFDRYATYHSWGSNRDKFKPPQLTKFRVSFIDLEVQALFEYLYELFLINEKIISLSEKRLEIILENFEYLL